ncbi:MAG TPA: OmpH family outer membrane protein [Myxococcaceae bacterium]|nr:OmpH family outer membrane protein [Myxococcaceae bacterium]
MSLRSFLATAAVAVPLTVASAARAEVKVAYVDLQRALLEVEEGRQAKSRLQNVLEGKQKELDKEQEGLRKEKELLDKQASAMSEETRIQKQTELQKKLFDLAQKWEKGKQEMGNKERTELQGIFQKMDPIIATIAQREGLSMVFEKTDSGLVYAPASMDLTNELVRLYNDKHKAGKASAAPNPGASKSAKAEAPKTDVPKK